MFEENSSFAIMVVLYTISSENLHIIIMKSGWGGGGGLFFVWQKSHNLVLIPFTPHVQGGKRGQIGKSLVVVRSLMSAE